MKKVFPKQLLTLVLILCFGFLIRIMGVNWDQAAFLHPDERFLIMVSNSFKNPPNIFTYLNPQVSTLNPVNTGNNFYVYGSLPPVIHYFFSGWGNNQSFLEKTLSGRLMAAILDSSVIILTYLIVQVLEKPFKLSKKTKSWAALFYALAVFPIQMAHFFTVDPFVNFFSLLGIYLTLKYHFAEKKIKYVFLSGISFAIALASKLTAIYPLVLAGCFLAWADWPKSKKGLKRIIGSVMGWGIIIYLATRFLNPGYFESANFFNPQLSAIFKTNLSLLATWSQPDTWFPPSIQWLNQPNWFAAKNLVLFGYGLIPSVIAFWGLGTGLIKFKKDKNLFSSGVWLIAGWCLGFMTWQSIQFVKTMRYFIFLYPWLAIFSAIGIENLLSHSKFNRNHFAKVLIILIMIFIWPLSFLQIYNQSHSRVDASRWLIEQLPEKSILLSEYWDDSLPVGNNLQYSHKFIHEQLKVFDRDSSTKVSELNQALKRGNYYILSSNRAWRSITANPDRYPYMSEFYQQLFANQTDYQLIKTFAVNPSLRWLGIPLDIPDQISEEVFTVYDHPKVWIFKNLKTDLSP